VKAAVVLALALLAAPVQSDGEAAPVPFASLEAGQQAVCRDQGGCVAMSRAALAQILQRAYIEGGKACRNTL
jgi:hypothetical protein